MKKILTVILLLALSFNTSQAARIDIEDAKNANPGIYTEGDAWIDLDSMTAELYNPVSVKLTPTTGVAHTEGLFYYDSVKKAFTAYNDEPDVSQQMGQEGWIRVYNDSGDDIQDGKICYLSGETTGGLTVDLAIANDAAKCLGTIGWATHTIEDGTWGYITRWGLLNNQNTFGETAVAKLWLSATSAGDYITTPPTSPNYMIGVGTMGNINATTGTIDVAVSIGTNTSGVIKIFNGAVLEDTSIVIASNGVDTVTLSYEKSGGGDLSLFFNGGFEIIDTTPAAEISLTVGSDIAPTMNYVFIPETTMVLTASTAGFPSAQHVPVATVLVQSAPSVDTDGAYKVHAWTDHLEGADEQGHLAHVNHWIRHQHATWNSGGLLTPAITVNGGAIDNVDIGVTSASVLQLHDHNYPAFDTATGSHTYVVNDDTTAYNRITDLNTIDEDSTGATLRSNNTYYSLIIWGSVSESSGDSQLFINLPGGFYATTIGVVDDLNKHSNYTIPSEFKGTGFLIARLSMRYQTADSGTITVIETEDLRGLIPSTAAGGGGASGGVEFPDNLFRVQNVADVTRQIAFDASGITTGNTRTITMTDSDFDLNNIVKSTTPTVAGNIPIYTGTDGLEVEDSGASIDSNGLSLAPGSDPNLTFQDSDAPGSGATDKYTSRITGPYIDGAEDAENSDLLFYIQQAGSFVLSFWVDESTDTVIFEKNTTLQDGDITENEIADLTFTTDTVITSTLVIDASISEHNVIIDENVTITFSNVPNAGDRRYIGLWTEQTAGDYTVTIGGVTVDLTASGKDIVVVSFSGTSIINAVVAQADVN